MKQHSNVDKPYWNQFLISDNEHDVTMTSSRSDVGLRKQLKTQQSETSITS